MVTKDGLKFASVVTDTHGKEHILVDGHIFTLEGSPDVTNEATRAIVRALRSSGEPLFGVAQSASSARSEDITLGSMAGF